MNGRIHDPELGRMLSPDPIVQVPEYSQNHNRYSYVLNNPLNLTDPTGYSWFFKVFHKLGNWISENWRTVVSIVFAAALFVIIGPGSFMGMFQGSMISSGWACGAVIGGLTGAFNAAINGGGIGDILRGGLIDAIQGGIAGGILHPMEMDASTWLDKAAHIAGHGIVGGAANEAMGGRFQDGFLSAAAGAYAGWTILKNTTIANSIGSTVAGRTAIAGAIGGTASALGGGKFANGAYTAAFQHLVNKEIAPPAAKKDQGRVLTVGEKAIAKAMFGKGLDTKIVRIHKIPFFPGARSMTPDGSIWPGRGDYSNDYGNEIAFAGGRGPSQSLFIHEMTHVYQQQNGMAVALKRVFLPGHNAKYSYFPFDPKKTWTDYGVEQQATIVQHYYESLRGAQNVWTDGNWHAPLPLATYKNLIPFK